MTLLFLTTGVRTVSKLNIHSNDMAKKSKNEEVLGSLFERDLLVDYLKKPTKEKLKKQRNDIVMLMLLSEMAYLETAQKYGAHFNCHIGSIEKFCSLIVKYSAEENSPKDLNIPCVFHVDLHHLAGNIREENGRLKIYIVDSISDTMNEIVILGIINEWLKKESKFDKSKCDIYFLGSGIQKDDESCPFFAFKIATSLSKIENMAEFTNKNAITFKDEYAACNIFAMDRKHTPALFQRLTQMPFDKFSSVYTDLLKDNPVIGKYNRSLKDHFKLFSPNTKSSYLKSIVDKYSKKSIEFLNSHLKDAAFIKDFVINHSARFSERLDQQIKSGAKTIYKHKI